MPNRKTFDDMNTRRIYLFLQKVDRVLGFKSPQISKLYLWRPSLFNAGLVEGTGYLIYSVILVFVHQSLAMSLLLPMPISFATKYLVYDKWLFKKTLDGIPVPQQTQRSTGAIHLITPATSVTKTTKKPEMKKPDGMARLQDVERSDIPKKGIEQKTK